jgi:hypothetical protein
MDSFAEEVANLQAAKPCYILDNCSVHNLEDITEACEMFGADAIAYSTVTKYLRQRRFRQCFFF